MTNLRAQLTITQAASAVAHAERDAVQERLERFNDELGMTGRFCVDPMGLRTAEKEARAGLPSAEKQLKAAAKKLGLSLGGAPDIAFDVCGGREGQLEIRYQATAR